jgi:hypothetical protein
MNRMDTSRKLEPHTATTHERAIVHILTSFRDSIVKVCSRLASTYITLEDSAYQLLYHTQPHSIHKHIQNSQTNSQEPKVNSQYRQDSTQRPTLKSSMKTTVTQKPKPSRSTSTSIFRGNATQQHSLRPAIHATTQMTTTRPSSSRTNGGSTSTVKPQPSSSGGPSSRTATGDPSSLFPGTITSRSPTV